MATGVIQGRFQFYDGTKEELEASDLILLKGELALETDDEGTTRIKRGDGRSKYADLPYITIGEIKVDELSEEDKALIRGPKGEKGDPFTFDDLTVSQRLDLKGDTGDVGPQGKPGESIRIAETFEDEENNVVVSFSDDTQITIPKGKALVFEDLTEEQKAELKGEKGDKLTFEDLSEEDKTELKGDKGEDAPKYQGSDYISINDDIISLAADKYIEDKKETIKGYIEEYQLSVDSEPTQGIWINNGTYQSLIGFTKIPDDYFTTDSNTPNEKKVYKVIMPNSITSVGKNAFLSNDIKDLKLSDNLLLIGASAFLNNVLKSIIFPDGLQSIGNYAFQKNALKSIILPGELQNIGDYAFENNKLEKIEFPDGLQSIGNYAFQNNALKSVIFPDELPSIGNYAFRNNALKSVIFPDELQSIGDYAFSNNPNIKEVVINKNTIYKPSSFPSTTKIILRN